MIGHDSALRIWNTFCDRFAVVKECVPLFDSSTAGLVQTRVIGRTSPRPVLARSAAMEAMVLTETDKLVADWRAGQHSLDGLIYFMGFKQQGTFMPLYIGKAESFGKGERNLSANLQNLHIDRSKFARWGDNYAYHVGDLSACVLPGHADEKQTVKYQAWAEQLFVDVPTTTPELRRPVYFWAIAWDRAMIGVWEELGPTSLAFLEYLLIGVAGRVSPYLLNREGVGRGGR